MMGYYGYGMGAYGWIAMLLFWGAVIWLIAWVMNRNLGIPVVHGTVQHRSPLDTLKERYAKGELSKKEFEEMKKDIEL